ncbi:MAG: ERF family protein [Nitrosomonadaceae bacterium]
MSDPETKPELVMEQESEISQELANAPTQATNIMQAVINAASDPTIDIDRVDRLLAIRNQIMDQEAEKSYAGAMSRTQANIGPIFKNKTNDHTHSGYSDLSAINAVVVPVYTAQGFSLSFSNKSSKTQNHIVVMCDVMHIDGHTKHYEYDLPFDGAGSQGNTNKTAIHASASSVSYGQRYLTNMIFNIATFDDDGNAAGRTQQQIVGITDDTLNKIQEGMDITGKSLEDCLTYINGVHGTDHARLTQFSESEGRRMLHKLNKCADGDQ